MVSALVGRSWLVLDFFDFYSLLFQLFNDLFFYFMFFLFFIGGGFNHSSLIFGGELWDSKSKT